MSCGPSHTLALTSTGRVFSWGMGRGGLLGHGEDVGQIRPRLIEAFATGAASREPSRTTRIVITQVGSRGLLRATVRVRVGSSHRTPDYKRLNEGGGSPRIIRSSRQTWTLYT